MYKQQILSNFSIVLVAVAFTISFTSCQKDKASESSKYIIVDAGIGSTTATRVRSTTFETGDEISIYAWSGDDFESSVSSPLVVNNSINTLDGSTWIAEPQMLWKDMVTPHYFVSTYPTQTITDFTAYEFPLSGNSLSDDLLFSTHTVGLTGDDGETVGLTFKHSQSKLIIELSFKNQFGDTPPMVSSVKALARKIAIVNFLTATTTAQTDALQSELEISEITTNTKYETVIVPQTINTIIITIAGNDYVYNNTAGIELKQGMTQTLRLVIGRDIVSLDGDMTIEDWATGDVVNGGNIEIN